MSHEAHDKLRVAIKNVAEHHAAMKEIANANVPAVNDEDVAEEHVDSSSGRR